MHFFRKTPNCNMFMFSYKIFYLRSPSNNAAINPNQTKLVKIIHSRQKNQTVFDRILWFQYHTGTEA